MKTKNNQWHLACSEEQKKRIILKEEIIIPPMWISEGTIEIISDNKQTNETN